jgi:Protein of unknown function (DUF3892)
MRDMTVYVTAIRLAGGNLHEHITDARWLDSGNSTSDTMPIGTWVDWLNKGNRAFVADSEGPVEVKVVAAQPAYIRTVKDNRWADNLLALPKY